MYIITCIHCKYTCTLQTANPYLYIYTSMYTCTCIICTLQTANAYLHITARYTCTCIHYKYTCTLQTANAHLHITAHVTHVHAYIISTHVLYKLQMHMTFYTSICTHHCTCFTCNCICIISTHVLYKL